MSNMAQSFAGSYPFHYRKCGPYPVHRPHIQVSVTTPTQHVPHHQHSPPYYTLDFPQIGLPYVHVHVHHMQAVPVIPPGLAYRYSHTHGPLRNWWMSI